MMAAGAAVQQRSADARWDLLIVCVAAFILTSVGRLHQLFPELMPLKPTLLAGVLALGLFALDTRRSRRLHTIESRSTLWGLALLLWVTLSIPGSLWPGGSFGMLAGDFIKTVLMFLVMIGAVRGARDVERLAWVYFAAAAIFAAVGIARFSGEGRMDRFPYYDANDFGVFAVTALPLGIYFIFSQPRKHLRIIAGAGLAVLLYAFIYANSRGGFIALIAVVAFFLVRQNTIPTRARVLGMVAITMLFLAAANDSFWERMSTILNPGEDYNLTTETGRWKVWGRGVGYMLDNPVFGVGAGSFGTAEGRLSGITKWTAPHNTYIQLGAELGIPGLLFFIAFIGSALAALRRVERASAAGAFGPMPKRLAQALMASLIGYMVGACFLSLAYAGMLWTLVALAVGLAKATGVARRPRKTAMGYRPRHHPPLQGSGEWVTDTGEATAH